ncbi:MAG: histone [Candidatus Heimdallarchaeota archaeon]|nr:histone [Candidatus Heimdallarchaeota archaeon]
MDRLLRNAGAARVSSTAKEALREILESLGSEISSRAYELSKHANRSTVTGEDVRLAFKKWLKTL